MDAEIHVAEDLLENYGNHIPESSYTQETDPALQVRLLLVVEQGDVIVYTEEIQTVIVTEDETDTAADAAVVTSSIPGEVHWSGSIDDSVDVTEPYQVTVKAALLDCLVTMG